MAGKNLTVRIWRGRADGALQTYRIPARDNQTVLDVVTEVQRRHEPALAYRLAGAGQRTQHVAFARKGAPARACPA